MDKKKLKLNIQKRVIPVLSVLALVFCLAVPTRAATNEVINFDEHMTIIDVTPEEFKVLIRFDPSDFDVRWNLYSSSWEEIDTLKAPSGQLEVPDGSSYTNMILKYYPMGYYSYVNLAYIPDGTVVDISFQGGITDPDYFTSDDGSIRTGLSMKFYDENFEQVGSTVYHYIDSTTLEYINGSFTMDKPDGAVYVRIDSIFRDFESNYTAFPVAAGSFTMKFSLPVSIVQQIEDDETKDLLQEVLDQLAVTDDNSDQIQGEVDSAVGDLESAGDALGSLDTPQVNVDELAPGEIFGDEYLAYVGVINVLYHDSTISRICSVMALLLVTSVILFGKRG